MIEWSELNSLMLSETKVVVSSLSQWTGLVVTAGVTLFLAFDGLTKILQVTPVVRATEKLGLPPYSTVPIGVVLLVCTALYALPKTAVIGALLLTAYLGGAVAIHVSAQSGAFPILFSIAFGALVWTGLALRNPALGACLTLRQ